MRDFVRDRNDRQPVVGQRRFGHQDLVVAVAQPRHHLGRHLAPRKFAEKLFDVLNLQRALLQRILLDAVFHVSGL